MNNYLERLFSGYSFRNKIEHEETGNLAVIQMKDLKNDYQDIGDELTRIYAESVPEKYLLQQGDVLFISKGANNKAVVFNKAIKAVAASAFFVLRPNKHKIIPEYLAWFINQRETQRYIEENRAGTYIPNVNKATVLGITIKLPPLDRQALIANIVKLSAREQKLMHQLINKKQTLITNLITNQL